MNRRLFAAVCARRHRARTLVLGCFLFAAAVARAEVETGHWLSAQCKPAGEACINYITGVLAGTTMAMAVTSGKTGTTLPAAYEVFLGICVPVEQDVSIEDQITVALAYLQAHPEERQQPAAGLVVTAQQHRWPCARPAGTE